MKIQLYDGSLVDFTVDRLTDTINKFNNDISNETKLDSDEVITVAKHIERLCLKLDRVPTLSEIHDMLEYYFMRLGAFDVAKKFIIYRHTKELAHGHQLNIDII